MLISYPSNFVIFHPRQRKIETNVQIVVNQQLLKQELSIKYLGVTLDSKLNWKGHISFIENKIKRSSCFFLSKLRYYINLSTLVQYFIYLISHSTKTIRLLALDFYEVIVDSGFALFNYRLIEISSS